MNILHIARQFYPVVGGTEKHIYEISRRLIRRGFKCAVLTLDYELISNKSRFDFYECYDGISVFRVPGFGYYKKPIPLKLPLGLFKWANIVHIHDLRLFFESSVLLKRLFNYRIVLTSHGFLMHTKDLRIVKNCLIPFYYRPSIERVVDALICVSEGDYRYVSDWNVESIHLIENGVDVDSLMRIPRAVKRGEFVYFGRIDINKGLDLLFYTLSFLKNEKWHLHIVGDGFKRVVRSLKRLANELSIKHRVTWHGFLADQSLKEILSRAHLCIFPSVSEGFGLTLVEAMGAGCLCVANNIPSFREIVDDGRNGFLVDFCDFKTASDKLRELLHSPLESLGSMSKSAREKIKKYDWDVSVDKMENVYNGLFLL